MVSLRNLADEALELSVVGSFTNLGYNARRKLFHWGELPSMAGRRVVVTGANSGLGFAAASRLAGLGATVHLVVRNRAKGLEAAARLVEAAAPEPVDVHVEVADLSDLDSVRAFASSFAAAHDRLDVLVHNAGALVHERQVTAQGNEVTVAAQVIGPFLLTVLLLPQLQASPDARVITVASGGLYSTALSISNLQSDRGEFNGTQAYARAKRCQVVLNREWARRLAGTTVVPLAMHPGWADTPGVEAALPTFRTVVGRALRSPEQGADTIVWLAAADEPRGAPGTFWLDRRRRSLHKVPWTRKGDDRDGELFAAIRVLSGYEGPLPGD
jgi:NAD(P)-dependent dehydrogenase (short-subunit alcohol dehydrogenase family)